jgi:response regulator RpfG family c-di-GMP phosphodiesterase
MTEVRQNPETLPACILVVEDEPLVRFPIAEALRELGIRVIEAASADEAWEYLQAGMPIDLVFTDHNMPGSMTGEQLSARIARVVTSGRSSGGGISQPILDKPYDLLKTAAALAELASKNSR